jgi:hypothetical protein
MKVLSWNIAHRQECWKHVAASDADVALLQEAAPPPPAVARRFDVNPGDWATQGGGRTRRWRTAVTVLNAGLEVEWIETAPLASAEDHQLGVSLPGTIAAARIRHPSFDRPLVLISMYGVWERPHASTGSGWIYADASVHRLLSDISNLIGAQRDHDIIASGDLNILNGYGENGSPYWASRYGSVFERAKSVGLKFVGPQHPRGRQAAPWPNELPAGSRNVPTYFTAMQKAPENATRQLDFVFASEGIADRLTVTALNAIEDWGPSDHARIEIQVAGDA